MKTKKKTLGTKFLEKFIDSRSRSPINFTDEVMTFLRKHKIEHSLLGQDYIDEWCFSLIYNYFGEHARILQIGIPSKNQPVLLGKGVLFDTGGYNLKTKMTGMHYDKNGALLAIAAAIDNKVPALVFFVTNEIDWYSPVEGDIMEETCTKQRILIDDTDAEGRIGLANLLGYIGKQLGVKSAITLATLTGSAVSFTGERTMALVHTNRPHDVLPKVLELYLEDGLELYPAPVHLEYDKSIHSKVKGSDIRSCGSMKGAGSQTAFSFLSRFFTGDLIHLDMAAMMTTKEGNGLVWGLKEVKALINLLQNEL